MRKLVLSVLCVVLIACSGTSITHGVIKEKNHYPAYSSTVMIPQYIPMCSYAGKTTVCTQTLIGFIPVTNNEPEQWVFKIEQCDNANPPKCETGNVNVDEQTYNSYEVGQTWTQSTTH